MTPARTRLVALAGAVAISFSAIWVGLAGVSPGTATFFRPAYAAPVLFALWLAFGRKSDGRSRRARGLAMVAGLFLGLDFAMWHEAIPRIGAGLATVFANMQVLFVAVLAWALHKERPSTAALVAVPVGFGGVVLASGLGRADAFGADPFLGAVFGTGAALAYTGFLLIFRQSGRGNASPTGPLLDATLGTAVAGLVLALATDPDFSLVPTWPEHAWLILLAVASHSGGWLAITFALPRLPALETSLILLMQPTLAMVWGAVFLAEFPSIIQWAGAGLVVTSVALTSAGDAVRSVRARRKRTRADTGTE